MAWFNDVKPPFLTRNFGANKSLLLFILKNALIFSIGVTG